MCRPVCRQDQTFESWTWTVWYLISNLAIFLIMFFFAPNTKNKLKFLIISSTINKAIESTNGWLYRLCQGYVTERKQKMLRVRLHNMIIFQPIRRRLSFKLANHDHRQIWNELWRPKLQTFLFTSTILIMERWVWVCKQSSVHLTYAFQVKLFLSRSSAVLVAERWWKRTNEVCES